MLVMLALCLTASSGIPDPGGGVGNFPGADGAKPRFSNGTHLTQEQANLLKKFAKVSTDSAPPIKGFPPIK